MQKYRILSCVRVQDALKVRDFGTKIHLYCYLNCCKRLIIKTANIGKFYLTIYAYYKKKGFHFNQVAK